MVLSRTLRLDQRKVVGVEAMAEHHVLVSPHPWDPSRGGFMLPEREREEAPAPARHGRRCFGGVEGGGGPIGEISSGVRRRNP